MQNSVRRCANSAVLRGKCQTKFLESFWKNLNKKNFSSRLAKQTTPRSLVQFNPQFDSMKKRLCLVLLVALGIGCIVILFCRNREPSYQGRTFSDWFGQYCHANTGDWDEDAREATEAFRQMGTNSLRLLVGQYLGNHRGSPFKTNFYRIANGILPWKTTYISPEAKQDKAREAIGEIKPSAKFLLPLLAKALDGTDGLLRREAVYLLGRVGDDAEQAVPYLVKALRQTNHWERVLAAQSLEFLDSHASPALPALIEALKDPSCPPQVIRAISNLGPEAKGATPQLRRWLTNSNQRARLYCAVALCRIDSQQHEAVDLLTDGIQSKTNSQFRKDVLWTVKDSKSEGVVFVPALLEAARDSDQEVWIAAIKALQNIQPESAIRALQEKLRTGDDQTRFNAASHILFYGYTNSQAVSAFANIITNSHRSLRLGSVHGLGYATNNANEAIAILQSLINDKDEQVQNEARQVIKHLQLNSSITNAPVKTQ